MLNVINESIEDESAYIQLQKIIDSELHIKFPFYALKADETYAGSREEGGWVASLYKWHDQYYCGQVEFNSGDLSTEQGTHKLLDNFKQLKKFGPRSKNKAEEFCTRCNEYAGLTDCKVVRISKLEDLFN